MGILDDRINEFISASCFAEKYEAWKDSYAKDIDDDYAKFMFATKIVGISQEAFESWVAEDATSVAWHIPGGCAISLQNEAASTEPATTTPATPTPTPATTEPATTEPATPTTEPATTEPATTEPATPTIEPTLTVSPTEVTIEVGEKTTITASLTSSVENPDYSWNVPAIVTGESTTASIEVTGAEAGTGTITVSAANLNASATITVTATTEEPAPVEPATPNAEP